MKAKPRKPLSSDKTLWIWAVIMTAGLLVFWILTRVNIPVVIDRTLVFAQWWEDELEEGILEKLADDFEEQNPGIKVRLERKSREEIKAMIAGTPDEAKAKKKKGADIYSLEGIWIDDLADRLAPLSIPGTAADGGSRAIPVISFINPLFYNIDLLKAAGFNKPPKNHTEFLSYAQTLAGSGENPGIYGAVLALGGGENGAGIDSDNISRGILSWIWPAALVRSGNSAEDTFRFTSRTVIETFSFLNQLKPYLYPDPFEVTEKTRLDAFMEGKAAMTIGPVCDIVKIREELNAEFGITTIPAPPAYVGKPVFALSGWYAGVSAESRLREEAETFTAFLSQQAAVLARSAFAVPGSGKRDPELVKDDVLYAKAYDMYDAGEMAREVYGTGRARDLNAIICGEIKRMFDGEQSPEETAEAIQKRWEAE
jgi:multiple sugar transport system substrate-binding protein